MQRLLILLAVASLLALAMSARTIRRTLDIFVGNVPETETLATGTTEFVYDYRYCVDTTGTLEDNYASDRMLLQIAPEGISKFSSYKNLTVDSLLLSLTTEQVGQAATEGKLSNGEFMTIYKNYPSSGRLTHTEKICQDWFKYEEEIPALNWEMLDSTLNVLGYECQGAKCNFRGREWTAFFTEEIPVMEGPWKLNGLPGLIMKATDENGQYIFECIGIKSQSSRPITMYKVPFNNVKRKEYYDTKHRYEINPYAYFETTTGGRITILDKNGNPNLDAFDPIDLPYEYIERDWQK